jgi:hypothetical protein
MLTAAALAAGNLAHAQTTPLPPAVNWLSNDPVTMFDWGLLQAQKTLDEAAVEFNRQEADAAKWEGMPANRGANHVETFKKQILIRETGYTMSFARASYDAQQTRIELGFQIRASASTSPQHPKTPDKKLTGQACATLLDDVRRLIFLKAGVPFLPDPRRYLEAAEGVIKLWFSHNGFRRDNEPPALYGNLAPVSAITVWLDQSMTMQPLVRCSAPLGGGAVTEIFRHN